MSKKMNSIEKYVKSITKNDEEKMPHRLKSNFSHYGSRLIYGGKITPDLEYKQLDDSKSYVKHSPLKDYETEDKINILENMGGQYERLKNGLSNREPYMSKHSLPILGKNTESIQRKGHQYST